MTAATFLQAAPVVPPSSLEDMVRALERGTIVSNDDKDLLVHRREWPVLRSMGPSQLRCAPICNERHKRAFPAISRLCAGIGCYGMPTHCLMRSHFAAHGVHHIDQQFPFVPEAHLVDTSMRNASVGMIGLGSGAGGAAIVRLRPAEDPTNPTVAAVHTTQRLLAGPCGTAPERHKQKWVLKCDADAGDGSGQRARPVLSLSASWSGVTSRWAPLTSSPESRAPPRWPVDPTTPRARHPLIHHAEPPELTAARPATKSSRGAAGPLVS